MHPRGPRVNFPASARARAPHLARKIYTRARPLHPQRARNARRPQHLPAHFAKRAKSCISCPAWISWPRRGGRAAIIARNGCAIRRGRSRFPGTRLCAGLSRAGTPYRRFSSSRGPPAPPDCSVEDVQGEDVGGKQSGGAGTHGYRAPDDGVRADRR